MENLWRVSDKDYIRDEKEHLSLSIIRTVTPFSKKQVKWGQHNTTWYVWHSFVSKLIWTQLSQEIKTFWTISTRLPVKKPQTILTCMYITAVSSSVWCLNNAPNYLTKASSACYAQNSTCILHCCTRWCSPDTRTGLEDSVGGYIWR